MSLIVGAALIGGSFLLLLLSLPRRGEPVAFLRSHTAQMTFMMTWIVAVLVGTCLVLLGPPPMMAGSFVDSVAAHAPPSKH